MTSKRKLRTTHMKDAASFLLLLWTHGIPIHPLKMVALQNWIIWFFKYWKIWLHRVLSWKRELKKAIETPESNRNATPDRKKWVHFYTFSVHAVIFGFSLYTCQDGRVHWVKGVLCLSGKYRWGCIVHAVHGHKWKGHSRGLRVEMLSKLALGVTFVFIAYLHQLFCAFDREAEK